MCLHVIICIVLCIKIGSIFECIYGNHPEVYCFPYLIIIIIIIGHNSASRTTDETEVDAHVHEASLIQTQTFQVCDHDFT